MSSRRGWHRLGRGGCLGLAASVVAGLVLSGAAQPAAAQFADRASAGPQTDQSATMPTPTVTTNSGSYSCYNDDGEVQIVLTWTSSAAKDPDNNYVVGYYGVYWSLNYGAYDFLGDTEGAPPASTYTFVAECSGNPGTAHVGFEVQAAQTTAGGGFEGAMSTPVVVPVTIENAPLVVGAPAVTEGTTPTGYQITVPSTDEAGTTTTGQVSTTTTAQVSTTTTGEVSTTTTGEVSTTTTTVG